MVMDVGRIIWFLVNLVTLTYIELPMSLEVPAVFLALLYLPY